VARPSGAKNEYFTGRKSGLSASVRAGRIIFTRMAGEFTDRALFGDTNSTGKFASEKIRLRA